MQSTVPSMVLQVLIMAHSSTVFLENYGGDGGTALPDRAGDGVKHYLLHDPSRSLIGDRGWSSVPSPVTYYGAKHHGADLSYTI